MPLFVLAFDHRANFAKNLLGFPYPRLNLTQRKKVIELKGIVFDGFLKVWREAGRSKSLAALIDEEFGAPIIKQAKQLGITFAIPTEKSGREIFEFEHGARYGARLKKIRPNFAKALVRYDVAQVKNNKLQRARLARLSAFCKKNKLGLMLEVLLTGTGSRFAQLEQMICEMLDGGVEPVILKLEGLDRASNWRRLRKYTKARIIVLGRGESRATVERWLKAAKQSKATDGFAIGRTIFFEPLELFLKKEISREEAVLRVADNFKHFIKLWKEVS